MSVRRIRLLLNSMTVLLCAGAGGVLWWAWESPMPDSAAGAATPASERRVAAKSKPPPGVTLEDFTDLWERPLRDPLYEKKPPPRPVAKTPAPVKPKPKPKPPPPLPMRLVGTIIESGRSMAIVADGSGKIDLKQAGEVLELKPPGVRVDEIQPKSVTVSYQGRERRLTMAKKAGDRRGRPRRRPSGNRR